MNQNHPTNSNEEDEQVEKLIQTLPRVSLRGSSFKMIEYEGFYYYNEDDIPTLTNAINFQKHFVARDTDIFIISPAKTDSGCRILYICRSCFDTLTSFVEVGMPFSPQEENDGIIQQIIY
ncbi:uncharacterized protein [Spinacia oleracea]|uniref:BAH domain-containing protein n=1 Tax=Spinacia oleracea TaxID=3562 RepID=A0A9R0J1W6_SPIOL|nr:uncharacterized protein LOC110798823 [Spinacia oleracea]